MQIDFVFSRCNFGVCLPPFYRNPPAFLLSMVSVTVPDANSSVLSVASLGA
jgi:hypothetical protein